MLWPLPTLVNTWRSSAADNIYPFIAFSVKYTQTIHKSLITALDWLFLANGEEAWQKLLKNRSASCLKSQQKFSFKIGKGEVGRLSAHFGHIVQVQQFWDDFRGDSCESTLNIFCHHEGLVEPGGKTDQISVSLPS